MVSARSRSSGQRVLELDALAGDRVVERDAPRVQERPVEPEPGRLVPPPAVATVAQDRVAGRREVDADLVRAARSRPGLHQGRALEPAPAPRPRSSAALPVVARATIRAPRPLQRRLDRSGGRSRASPAPAPGTGGPPRAGGTARPAPGTPASSFATTISPDVPASSRWTIPGRSASSPGNSGTPLPSRRFTSVPSRRAAVGCTGIPAGFDSTSRCSSSNRTSSGPGSAGRSPGSRSGGLDRLAARQAERLRAARRRRRARGPPRSRAARRRG